MASKTNAIKTTLTLDGERQYTEALKRSKQELKVMGSELKAATAEYQLAGDRMDYLRKRTDILNRGIAEQEKIIRTTAEMYEKAAAGGEAFASRANRLNIQLNDARASLARMKKELQTTDRELEELGRDSVTTGRNLERGITDGAEDAARELRQLARESQDSLAEISTIGRLQMIGNMAGVVVEFSRGVYEWTQAAQEYNLSVGKLKANAETSGADWEAVEKEFLRVAALTGDANAAVNGINSLINSGYTTAVDLEEVTALLMGATVKYSELSFEGLAASLQETLAKKEATGDFATLLEKMQIDVGKVNQGLRSGKLTSTQLQYLLAELDKDGKLAEVLKAYTDQNSGVVAAAEAQAKLNHEINELGGHAAEWFTPAITWMGSYVEKVNAAAAAQKSWIEALTDPLAKAAIQEFNEATGIVVEGEGQQAEGYVSYQEVQQLEEQAKQEHEANRKLREQEEGHAGTWYTKYLLEQGVLQPEDLIEDFVDTMEQEEQTVDQAGQAVGDALGQGMETGLQPHLDQLQARVDAAADAMRKSVEAIFSTPTTGAGSAGGGRPIMITLDGRKVGQALLPYTDAAQGKAWTAQTVING